MTYEQDLLDIAKEMREAAEQDPYDLHKATQQAAVEELMRMFPGLKNITGPVFFRAPGAEQTWLVVPYYVEVLGDRPKMRIIKFLRVTETDGLGVKLRPEEIGDTSTPTHREAILEEIVRVFKMQNCDEDGSIILTWRK